MNGGCQSLRNARLPDLRGGHVGQAGDHDLLERRLDVGRLQRQSLLHPPGLQDWDVTSDPQQVGQPHDNGQSPRRGERAHSSARAVPCSPGCFAHSGQSQRASAPAPLRRFWSAPYDTLQRGARMMVRIDVAGNRPHPTATRQPPGRAGGYAVKRMAVSGGGSSRAGWSDRPW